MVYAHANKFNHVGEFFLGEIRNQTLIKQSSCEGIEMAVIKFCTEYSSVIIRKCRQLTYVGNSI